MRMFTFYLNCLMSISLPKSSNIVLIVTEHLAISTSTSKVSPSELCNLMFGMLAICQKKSRNTNKHSTNAKINPFFYIMLY